MRSFPLCSFSSSFLWGCSMESLIIFRWLCAPHSYGCLALPSVLSGKCNVLTQQVHRGNLWLQSQSQTLEGQMQMWRTVQVFLEHLVPLTEYSSLFPNNTLSLREQGYTVYSASWIDPKLGQMSRWGLLREKTFFHKSSFRGQASALSDFFI